MNLKKLFKKATYRIVKNMLIPLLASKHNIVFLCAFFSTTSFSQQTEKWGDQGNGSYSNPVLPADYSDIDAIRMGADYYAISSTMQFSPGVIILHSKDLVNWQIIGHVVNDLTQISPELNWNNMNRYGRGIWAGSIRYHEGKFWVYFGSPDEGFFMSTAKDPAGPWDPLHKFWGVQGWDDCCPFWDDDGQGYFVATNFADNYKIHLFKMSPDGKEIILESDSVIHQSKGSEANKLYKFNGIYYHLFSEVKKEGRVAMMGRSKNIYGPYETRQLNHVDALTDKEPNQGGIIQAQSGEWYFFTHQGTGSWEGRAACLLPVTWINGWPVIGQIGSDTIGNMIWNANKPVSKSNIMGPQTDNEFNQSYLPAQWEWNYQPRNEKWSLTDHMGFLRLYAFLPVTSLNKNDQRKVLYRAGNTLTQRSMRTAWNEATVKINIGEMENGQFAGLCHFGGTYSTFGIRQIDGNRVLVFDDNGKETPGPGIKQTTIWFRSSWNWLGTSWYGYSLDGKTFVRFGKTYQLKWGFYRGDRIGICNYNIAQEKGFIDLDWFHYSYSNQKPNDSN
jgi:beta-xylosidase